MKPFPLFIGLLAYTFIFDLKAQNAEASEASPYRTVEFDLNSQTVKNYIPFDEPFILKGQADSLTTSIICSVQVKGTSNWIVVGKTQTFVKSSNYDFYFLVNRLKPNKTYIFKLDIVKKLESKKQKKIVVQFRNIVTKKLDELASSGTSVFTRAEYTNLHTGIKREVSALFPQNSGLVVDFSKTILETNQWNTKKTDFDRLLGDYVTRNNELNSYRAAQEDMVDQFQVIKHHDLSNQLLRYAIAKEVSEQHLLFSFNFLTTTEIEKIAFGFDGLKDEKQVISFNSYRIDNVWNPDSLVFLTDNLERTRSSINQLRQYVNREFVSTRTNRKDLVPTYSRLSDPGKEVALETIDGLISEFLDELVRLEGKVISTISQLNDLKTALISINNKTDKVISDIRIDSKSSMTVVGSSSEEFTTRGAWYIGTDYGFTHFLNIDEIRPYFGVNIYFVPVNKKASYKFSDATSDKEFFESLLKHTSLSIGLPILSVKNDEKGIDDLFGERSLMTGVGFRFGKAFKASYGLLWFKADTNSNPLITNKEVQTSHYLSLSVDADLLGLFGKLGSKIFE